MKRILAILLSVLLLASPSLAKDESSSRDAASVVLYGNNNGTIVPIKVDATGVVDISGAGVNDAEYLVSTAHADLSAEDVVTEGYMVDYTNGAGTGTFAVDTTEMDAADTFGDGTQTSITHTYDFSSGTDPTVAYSTNRAHLTGNVGGTFGYRVTNNSLPGSMEMGLATAYGGYFGRVGTGLGGFAFPDAGDIVPIRNLGLDDGNVNIGRDGFRFGSFIGYDLNLADDAVIGDDLGVSGQVSFGNPAATSNQMYVTNGLGTTGLVVYALSTTSTIPVMLLESTGTSASNYTLQTFSGNGSGIIHYDSGPVVINEGGGTAVDLRVESDSNTHAIFVDASANTTGFNESSPVYNIDINSTVAGDRGINLDWSGNGSTGIYVSGTGAQTSSNYGFIVQHLTTNTTTDGLEKIGFQINSTGNFTGGAGTANKNYGGYFTASGGDENWAIYAPTGDTYVGGDLWMTDDNWTGLGSSAGRIEFDDQSTDEVLIKNAYLGVGDVTQPRGELHVSGTAGQIWFTDSDTSVDYKHWRWRATDESWYFELINDAVSASTVFIQATRAGMTASEYRLVNGKFVLGSGSAGFEMDDDGDGALTMKARGDGSNEDLTLNLDDTANTAFWSSSTGLNKWAIANGTGDTEFYLYSDFTDASNYSRLELATQTSNSVIGILSRGAGTVSPQALEIGTVGVTDLYFTTQNVIRWYVKSNGHLVSNSDNSYDIGESGAKRPRNVYVGTDVFVATEAYDATGWNGDLSVPTKDAVRDKFESLSSGGDGMPNGGYFVGTRYYYGWPYFTNNNTGNALVADRLYARPFMVGKTTTFERIGCNILTAAASSSIRIGIYNFENGLPTSLVLDAGTVDSSSTGVKEITISQQLTPGAYAFAWVSNGTPTPIATGAPGTGDVEYFWGAPDTSTGSTIRQAYYAFTYAALPANFSSSVTYDTSNNPAAVFLRDAS